MIHFNNLLNESIIKKNLGKIAIPIMIFICLGIFFLNPLIFKYINKDELTRNYDHKKIEYIDCLPGISVITIINFIVFAFFFFLYDKIPEKFMILFMIFLFLIPFFLNPLIFEYINKDKLTRNYDLEKIKYINCIPGTSIITSINLIVVYLMLYL